MSLSSGVPHPEYVQRLQVLWADIQADEAFAEIPNTIAGSIEIAAAYNREADPVFIGWFDVASQDVQNVWSWEEHASLLERRQGSMRDMTSNGIVRTTSANNRDGLGRIWGESSISRTAILNLAKKPVTRAERMFASGTGTQEVPGDLTFRGNLPWQDVHSARNM